MPKTSNGQHLYITGMRNLQELAYESESEDEESIVRETRSNTSFGEIMAQARTPRDVVTEDRKRSNTAKEKESERSDSRADTPRSRVQASMPDLIGLSRAQKAPRENDQYHPEDPLLKRHPFAGKDTNHLQSKRDQYSSVPLCQHLELFLDWNMDDPDNRKGSWILNIERYEEPSPWAEHQHCAGVDVTKMADALAMRIIKKFTRLDNERVSRDFDRGISCRRPPAKQRLTRELCNMYSQIHRGKESKLVDGKEALRESLIAAERRKELAGESLLRTQKSGQSGAAAKPFNNDVPEARNKSSSASVPGSSPSTKKRKTPKQIAEEKVARNRKRKGLSEIARIRAEPIDRFKPTTVDERDARLTGVAQQVRHGRAQLAAQKRKLSETEDDTPSHVLPSSRLIKKAKKNSVTKEVV
ncbi:uncharacterized protein J4E88_010037 [Alternaria novae-zelandiae]|uniref:uncharacterized protein n=1 Tax=Alternaria novae-zelandiae TaxID=430562 RepID=UPI0020C568D8|nr:uncharacterized protein J4E88_010037 [Alternaria novae-zelandiae]KAI4667787.1 hypothetical protein J4E88_010037 [Alternaria novae-zelandiae]